MSKQADVSQEAHADGNGHGAEAQEPATAPPGDNASSPKSENATGEKATGEEATDEEATSSSDLLGTFSGVYRPTVLTILGLMMYVREGWVVGQAGLLGTMLIILLTFVISGTAAFSLSSITTNIHIGAGGVFSIISKSLGLESGGSIGVPFYLGQGLSAALYIYGFMEAWRYVFPDHSMWLVVYGVFAVVFVTTLISTNLAFKLQGVVMLVIVASLVSIVLGATSVGRSEPLRSPQLWGTFESGGFWVLFAIFFPGGTGVNVGASMSGALQKPQRSIPVGTLAAVGTALAVYLGMAVWYSLVAAPEALRANRLLVIKEAALGELVLAGVLASTFTAALSAMVAAPRVLQALAKQNVVPGSNFFGQLTAKGEPRNAILTTGALVATAMTLGSLDAVAKLITMFFLLTYLTVNLVVAVEQSLGLISFRPTFRIPRWVPLLGVFACAAALFIINPLVALVAVAIVFGIYVYLVSRELDTPWETMRSSIFVSLADWAAKRIGNRVEEANERAWKPDLLVPVTSRGQLDGMFGFLRLLVEPKGSIKVIGVREQADGEKEKERAPDDRDDPAAATDPDAAPTAGTKAPPDGLDTLPRVTQSFHRKAVMATSTLVRAPSLLQGVEMSASVLRGSAFRPNVLFGLAHRLGEDELQGFVDIAAQYDMGAALLYEHHEAMLSQEQRINVWVSDQSPDWKLSLRLPNLDLSVLLAYQVARKWQGTLRLLTVCREEEQMPQARDYLHRLIEDARLPGAVETWVAAGDFREQFADVPEADLSVLGLPREVDAALMKRAVRETRSTCLFVRDSGWESALA